MPEAAPFGKSIPERAAAPLPRRHPRKSLRRAGKSPTARSGGSTDMIILCSYEGKSRRIEVAEKSARIGRRVQNSGVTVDLSADPSISRVHARIWVEGGACWIEDLQSRYGTYVNDRRLETPWKIRPGDVITLGDTVLSVELESLAGGNFADEFEFPTQMDARAASSSHKLANSSVLERDQLGLLLDLPLQLAAMQELGGLMQLIVERVVGVIRGATRGALMLMEGDEKPQLQLRGSVPKGEKPISRTLAQRTVDDGRAFVWNKSAGGGALMDSMTHFEAGMYAPLCWNKETLGVICVDNQGGNASFSEDDLRLLIAVAQYSAAAVSNRKMQETLLFNAEVLDRLLTSFSPKVRTWLLARARAGKLQTGGEESEVTILQSDVRGFAALSGPMDTASTMDMLNDYFSPLVEVIFAHDGTIDKFLGDGILVVFGSPEPDPDQHLKAVRAAVAMQAKVAEVSRLRRQRGRLVCEMGIGIHCGTVRHGFIGGAQRLEFTVIGDTVNRASRYCDGAQAGEVLISAELHGHVSGEFPATPVEIPIKHEGTWVAHLVHGTRRAAME
jgi:adenylate cyclase